MTTSVWEGSVLNTEVRAMKKTTPVPLEHLQNLPRLEVPDIHLRVFATTHDRLSSSYTKTCEQTIRRIGVSFVSFDAFRRLSVPKSDGGVLRHCEDKF